MSQSSILVLDDDPAVGDTIRFIGESMGFEVSTLTDPAEFFDTLDLWDPSHIVLDLVMPKMDGVEVIRRLAERGCTARIIISSGVGGRVLDAAHRAAREQGLSITGVLPKPFSPSAMKAFLRDGIGPRPAAGKPSDSGREDQIEVDEKSMLEGLHKNQFGVVFQPVLICASGNIAGFETLARWAHPAGTIMPDRFIPVAESLGLIDQMTRQIASQAMNWMATAYGTHNWTLSINISAASLGSKKLADRLENMCLEAGLSPERLILELTESVAMEDPVTGLEQLTRLRMKGFHLSIDDFGTGYSSLAQLARMPFSELKVDKSFVMTAEDSSESRTIVHSIVDLGHNLGLRVVAEGVEDAKTLEFLRNIGCDFAQGYHISYPLPADQARQWVTDRSGILPDL